MSTINTMWLFSDYESGFDRAFKSQRASFFLQTAEVDFPRFLSYVIGVSLVPRFAQTVLPFVPAALIENGIHEISSSQHCDLSWDIFTRLCNVKLEESGTAPALSSAVESLIRGVRYLTTHMDKSSELPQSFTPRDSFMKHLCKSMEIPFSGFESRDARALIFEAHGNDELGNSITMSKQDQAALGVVCCSDQPLVTSVGDAKFAPLQNFFCIQFKFQGRGHSSMLSVMVDKRLDMIGLMLGIDEPTEVDLRNWLAEEQGVRPFLAGLYFGIGFMAYGEYEEEVAEIFRRVGEPVGIAPKELFNTVRGAGLNMIRLPVEGGYHKATPLVNAGLLRDVHNQFYRSNYKKDAFQWRRMFTTISIGGSKPQNAGTFFTSIAGNGKLKAFKSRLPGHFGTGNTFTRILEGRSLYYCNVETGRTFCNRPEFEDDTQSKVKLSKRTSLVIRERLEVYVRDAVNHLIRLSDRLDAILGALNLSRAEFVACSRNNLSRSERELLCGMAGDQTISTYSRYLALELFSYTNLTKAEQAYIYVQLRLILIKQLGEV